jgi:hypothetical protein
MYSLHWNDDNGQHMVVSNSPRAIWDCYYYTRHGLEKHDGTVDIYMWMTDISTGLFLDPEQGSGLPCKRDKAKILVKKSRFPNQ